MAELADAADSKSAGLRPLGVQVPLPAPASKALPRACFGRIQSSRREQANFLAGFDCAQFCSYPDPLCYLTALCGVPTEAAACGSLSPPVPFRIFFVRWI